MRKLPKLAASVTALLVAGALACAAAPPESTATVVELESPLSAAPPLQGLLRQPNGASSAAAVVLLHACNGNWRGLDERWGKRIASWGYATLTVDSFGPRGIRTACGSVAVDMGSDAYRALAYLARQPSVDPARVAVVGFSLGASLALMSVERGAIERASAHKFRAAAAFYPPCLAFKDDMTVPVLVLIGERDDWTLAGECRNMVEGRDDYGISRHRGDGVPMRLIVYPDAWHAFDAPQLKTPVQYLGHRLQFNAPAAEQASEALRAFLDETLGGKAGAEAAPGCPTARKAGTTLSASC
ncbi:MAG TPA: dienelactone hydrolase family protein [Bradyrhizobium sp.]|nr:dienelactone hydrolase family protein [Bradyrhizobium sp.]